MSKTSQLKEQLEKVQFSSKNLDCLTLVAKKLKTSKLKNQLEIVHFNSKSLDCKLLWQKR